MSLWGLANYDEIAVAYNDLNLRCNTFFGGVRLHYKSVRYISTVRWLSQCYKNYGRSLQFHIHMKITKGKNVCKSEEKKNSTNIYVFSL